MLFKLTWYFVLIAPYLILMVGGLLLLRRRSSLATVMVAVGFTAMFITMLTSLFESLEYSDLDPRGALMLAHHRTLTQVIHWAGLAGLWAASTGLVWHATRQR